MNKEQPKHSGDTISCIIQITLQSAILREIKAALPIHTETQQQWGRRWGGGALPQAQAEKRSSGVPVAGHAMVSDSTHAHTSFPN